MEAQRMGRRKRKVRKGTSRKEDEFKNQEEKEGREDGHEMEKTGSYLEYRFES